MSLDRPSCQLNWSFPEEEHLRRRACAQIEGVIAVGAGLKSSVRNGRMDRMGERH